MEKENKRVSLDERLAKIKEMSKEYQFCTFQYRFIKSPYKKDGCKYFELSHEEADKITPQLEEVFKKGLEVSKFDIVCQSDGSFLKLGIEDGEGYADGQGYRFGYLMVQNGEFAGVQMCCKNKEGNGIDHEIYPIFSVSCLSDDSQELISSILDIVEDRLV